MASIALKHVDSEIGTLSTLEWKLWVGALSWNAKGPEFDFNLKKKNTSFMFLLILIYSFISNSFHIKHSLTTISRK